METRFIPFIYEGQVVATDDPDEMGRVKVWVPALDGEFYEINALPWAEYASPLAGFTSDYPMGNGSVDNPAQQAYGFWAVPKMGASVYVFCLGGDPTRRIYFASAFRLHRNRSLPVGRNFDLKGREGPWGDAGDENQNLFPMEPAFTNIREQFQNKLKESESITRGVYERMVAQPKFEKSDEEGYGKNPIDGSYLDCQSYCLVTPGGHALIFQDDPRFSRLRMKTAEGHQVIFDDANERIYVSTAKGASWFEMDQDGHIHCYGADSISFRSGKDINFFADGDINLEAGKGVNIKADSESIKIDAKKDLSLRSAEKTFLTACKDIHICGDQGMKLTLDQSFDVNLGQDFTLTSGRQIDVLSSSNIKIKGSRIDLNGPTPRSAKQADPAPAAAGPSIVPGHEPWRRPDATITRNKNWKR